MNASVNSNQPYVNNDKRDWFEAAMWGAIGASALSTIPFSAALTGACGLAALASLSSRNHPPQ